MLRPSLTGEQRAEISGPAKSDSPLREQEAVCLQVVAGARFELLAMFRSQSTLPAVFGVSGDPSTRSSCNTSGTPGPTTRA